MGHIPFETFNLCQSLASSIVIMRAQGSSICCGPTHISKRLILPTTILKMIIEHNISPILALDHENTVSNNLQLTLKQFKKRGISCSIDQSSDQFFPIIKNRFGYVVFVSYHQAYQVTGFDTGACIFNDFDVINDNESEMLKLQEHLGVKMKYLVLMAGNRFG